MTEGLADDEQRGFRGGRGCVDQIVTIKQICEKVREKKRRKYMGFMDFEKVHDRVNRMYDVGSNRLSGMLIVKPMQG